MNRAFGLAFGAVYLIVGAAGFIVTRGVEFAATEGNNLIFFEVNPLHNIVHLAVGALLVGGALAGAMWSMRVNTIVGITYIAIGALGLFIANTSLNIFAFNAADHALHFATGILAVAVGSMGLKEATAYGPSVLPRGSSAFSTLKEVLSPNPWVDNAGSYSSPVIGRHIELGGRKWRRPIQWPARCMTWDLPHGRAVP